MATKPKKQRAKRENGASHQAKTATEKAEYWKRQANAPDLGPTEPEGAATNSSAPRTAVSGDGMAAGGTGRHRLDVDKRDGFWRQNSGVMSLIVSAIMLLIVGGTLVFNRGRYAADLAHTEKTLQHVTNANDKRGKELSEAESRLATLEEQVKTLKETSDARSDWGKSVTQLAADLKALRETSTKADGSMIARLDKLESRVDDLFKIIRDR